jgi:hypothetical protein
MFSTSLVVAFKQQPLSQAPNLVFFFFFFSLAADVVSPTPGVGLIGNPETNSPEVLPIPDMLQLAAWLGRTSEKKYKGTPKV